MARTVGCWVCGSARRVMCELRGAGRCGACGVVVCEVAVYDLEACVIAGYGAAGEWNGRVAVVIVGRCVVLSGNVCVCVGGGGGGEWVRFGVGG